MDFVEELLPELMFQAADVSDTALRRALRLGAQDLLINSDLWVQELSPISLYANLQRYTMRLPTSTRISRVEWVKLDGQPLEPLELEDIAENDEIGFHITNDHPHQLVVTDKTPRGQIRMAVRLYPTNTATDLPEWLVQDFRTALVNSALIKVYGMPGSPWFDPNLAQLLGSQVQSAILNGQRLISNRKRGRRRVVRYGGL